MTTSTVNPQPARTELGETLNVGGWGILRADSADKQWTYEYDETNTDWRITHNPTGLETLVHTLDEGREWTASDDALDELRGLAESWLAPQTTLPDGTKSGPYVLAEQIARATRALMVFSGTLLPAGTPVDALCDCGGLLAHQRGEWVHVDSCVEELHDPGQPCPDNRDQHKVCPEPSPAQCLHPQCRQSNVFNSYGPFPCPFDLALCCGVHHGGQS